MNAAERKALADIEKHGFHIINVMEEDDLPGFVYTLGIQRTAAAPEVIVIGLKERLAQFVVSEYHRRVRAGESFVPGGMYGDFIEGFEVTFVVVDKSHYPLYLGWDLWLYDGDGFDALQMVYPTTKGVWPWDEGVPEDFREWQPILTRTGHVAERPRS